MEEVYLKVYKTLTEVQESIVPTISIFTIATAFLLNPQLTLLVWY